MVEREHHDHDAHAGHDHDDNYRSAGRRRLIIVLILLCCHMGIEIAGGILSGSLGLLAHAAHMIFRTCYQPVGSLDPLPLVAAQHQR